MGITLILVMSMLAFIINVGLFVKAKINLQNATDAAAFSGAATQARQLTNIAYMNWELHNTYKEWMFKYYVLGQMGLFPYGLSDSNIGGTGSINYTVPTPGVAGLGSDPKFNNFDRYNIPSICIHNNTSHNICQIYAVPGIPRFPALGVAGISEIHEAFVNTLTAKKAEDCSRRSTLNYLTAQTWAFGTGGDEIDTKTPLIATNRPGAWPEALQIAMRIRNLEMIVNRPPVTDPIDRNVAAELSSQNQDVGFNERPVKAFWSAFRNLGGGAYKDANQGQNEELSFNFKLYELKPQAYEADPQSVSGFLIPPDAKFPGSHLSETTPFKKSYLDLQMMPVNLATMFSTFVTMANDNVDIGVKSEGTCGVSKTALPVPGYILGFNKNPEVVTYYAVKAESKFIGLFFPIVGSTGFTLTAYSAAKPFGGRIGPKLFSYESGDKSLVARKDINRRSAPFVSGLHIQVDTGSFKPGMPIPSSQKFWVESGIPLGGVPGANLDIRYGLPNMIYDFSTLGDLSNQQQGSTPVQDIYPLLFVNESTKEKLGLYNATQIRSLKASITGFGTAGSTMSGENVLQAIVRSRRPTRYDVINYLVPDFREVDAGNNAPPYVIKRAPSEGGGGFKYKLFAPLLGHQLLYENSSSVLTVVKAYMTANSQAIDTYLKSLLEVANSIIALNATTKNDNTDSAKTIHFFAGTSTFTPPPLPIGVPDTDPTCPPDMASKYNFFFKSESLKAGCGILPLQAQMTNYIDKLSTTADNGLFYTGYYFNDPTVPQLTLPPEALMTAYFPGPRQGTSPGDKALAEHPLKLSSADNASYSTRRNYYSTKFFQISKVIDSPPASGCGDCRRSSKDYITPALREELINAPDDLVGKVQQKNPLKFNDAQGINSNPYFLDF